MRSVVTTKFNIFVFQFVTFFLQNATSLDGKIEATVNINFSQSNSIIWQFPLLVGHSHTGCGTLQLNGYDNWIFMELQVRSWSAFFELNITITIDNTTNQIHKTLNSSFSLPYHSFRDPWIK